MFSLIATAQNSSLSLSLLTHTHTRAHPYICTHVYIHACTCMQAHTHMHTHTIPHLPSSSLSMHFLLCHCLSSLWPVTLSFPKPLGSITSSLTPLLWGAATWTSVEPILHFITNSSLGGPLAKTGSRHFHILALLFSDSRAECQGVLSAPAQMPLLKTFFPRTSLPPPHKHTS